MRYAGLMFYPQDAKLTLGADHLSPIQGKTAHDLFAQFKREMDGEEFDARVETGEANEPILVRFRRVGQTAAYAAFARGANGTPQRLDAVVAFLSGLDRDEDERVLTKLRAAPSLGTIRESAWSDVQEVEGPATAAFFTNEGALNNPILHGLMSLAGAAFLDRLGLLE